MIFAGAACLVLSVIADPRGLLRFLPNELKEFLFHGCLPLSRSTVSFFFDVFSLLFFLKFFLFEDLVFLAVNFFCLVCDFGEFFL